LYYLFEKSTRHIAISFNYFASCVTTTLFNITIIYIKIYLSTLKESLEKQEWKKIKGLKNDFDGGRWKANTGDP